MCLILTTLHDRHQNVSRQLPLDSPSDHDRARQSPGTSLIKETYIRVPRSHQCPVVGMGTLHQATTRTEGQT